MGWGRCGILGRAPGPPPGPLCTKAPGSSASPSQRRLVPLSGVRAPSGGRGGTAQARPGQDLGPRAGNCLAARWGLKGINVRSASEEERASDSRVLPQTAVSEAWWAQLRVGRAARPHPPTPGATPSRVAAGPLWHQAWLRAGKGSFILRCQWSQKGRIKMAAWGKPKPASVASGLRSHSAGPPGRHPFASLRPRGCGLQREAHGLCDHGQPGLISCFPSSVI